MKWAGLLVVVAIASAWGCAEPQPRAPAQIAAARRVKHPSWVKKLELSDKKADQALAILARARVAMKEYEPLRLALLNELLKQVRTGVLDRDRLAALAEPTVAQLELALPTLLTEMNELHALLSTAERGKLLDLMEGSKAETDEQRQAQRQERIRRILDLNAAQKAQILPAILGIGLAHYGFIREMKRDLKEAVEQFRSEQFDAHSLALIEHRRPMQLLIVFYEAVEATLPILTEAQRRTLAAYLDARIR